MSAKNLDEVPTLSAKEFLILKMLENSGTAYGLELVKESGGELKRGTIYVTLGRMEDKGLVESDLEKLGGNEPGPARRLYSITGQGVRVLRVWTLMKNAWVRGLSVA